jgi:hypothetical protein
LFQILELQQERTGDLHFSFSERETGCSESFLKHSDEAWKWILVLELQNIININSENQTPKLITRSENQSSATANCKTNNSLEQHKVSRLK